jgi:hypothetical protein
LSEIARSFPHISGNVREPRHTCGSGGNEVRGGMGASLKSSVSFFPLLSAFRFLLQKRRETTEAEQLCLPTLAPEKRRKDGARKVISNYGFLITEDRF